jgi:hypothetical protein
MSAALAAVMLNASVKTPRKVNFVFIVYTAPELE